MTDEALDYVNELAGRQAARAPATFGEIWSSEWTRAGLDTFGGVGRPLTESYTELVNAVESAYGGVSVGDLARSRGFRLDQGLDASVRGLGELIDTLPEEERKRVERFKDVRARAAEKAAAIEKDASDVAGATFGLSGTAVSYAAGISRQVVDPANLIANVATAPIGGPFKAPLIPMLTRQAVSGAIAQAAVEPYIQSARAELGLEAGFAKGATNIAEAAIGAAGIAGLLRAGAWGIRTATRGLTGKEIPFLTPEAPAEGGNRFLAGPIGSVRDLWDRVRGVAPEDLEAAARVLERDQAIDAAGRAAPEKIDEAAADMGGGKGGRARARATRRGADCRARRAGHRA
jgi:hypothetical protein